jgi:hypothetical protein
MVVLVQSLLVTEPPDQTHSGIGNIKQNKTSTVTYYCNYYTSQYQIKDMLPRSIVASSKIYGINGKSCHVSQHHTCAIFFCHRHAKIEVIAAYKR